MRFGSIPVSPEPSHGRRNAGDARICVTYETVRQWGKSSARHSPIRSVSARLLAATNGIWMRSSSRSPASDTGSGAPSIRAALFSTSWSNVEEIPARRSGPWRGF